jgi:hypothetical protein
VDRIGCRATLAYSAKLISPARLRVEIERFEIDKDGKIVVVAEKSPESPCDGEDERNEWDDADDTPSTTIPKRVS